MNLESTHTDRIPFGDPEVIFDGFSKEDIINLAYCAGDLMLAIDEAGVIRDIAVNVRDHGFANMWIGQRWSDTVTIESQGKIAQLLASGPASGAVWRQVNHMHDGDDVPVNYKVITPQNGGWKVAIGRDLRSVSKLQQRLLKTQQSMERDRNTLPAIIRQYILSGPHRRCRRARHTAGKSRLPRACKCSTGIA